MQVPLLHHAVLVALVDSEHGSSGRRRRRVEADEAARWKRRHDSSRAGVTSAIVVATGGNGRLIELSGKRNAVTVACQIAIAASEGSLLSGLIVDAAVVHEVEHSVSAADHGFPVSKQIIGEADARAEVVVVLADDAARDTVLTR